MKFIETQKFIIDLQNLQDILKLFTKYCHTAHRAR